MKRTYIILRELHRDEIRNLIADESGDEGATYVLFGQCEIGCDPRSRYTSFEVIPIPGEDRISASERHVTWKTKSFVNLCCCTKEALTAQKYRIRHRISQIRFFDSALLHPVCEVGRRGFVALRYGILGGPVGEQRLDFRTVLVQLAFAGAFRSSDWPAGSPSRAKGFLRPRGEQPRSISAAIFPKKADQNHPRKLGGAKLMI